MEMLAVVSPHTFRPMPRTFLIALALFPLLPLYAQRGTHDILADEQKRFAAMTQRDTARLRQMLHERLVYIHSNALTEDREQHLSAIGTGKIVYQRMTAQGVRVRRFGKMALTQGTLDVQGMLNEKTFDLKLAYTAVYRKQRGTWCLLNWQSTRIP